jgi:hypothetical protein
MLDTGFDPGLWGSVSVSQLFPHISLHTTARHVLKPDLGSSGVNGPEYVVICMHEKLCIRPPIPEWVCNPPYETLRMHLSLTAHIESPAGHRPLDRMDLFGSYQTALSSSFVVSHQLAGIGQIKLHARDSLVAFFDIVYHLIHCEAVSFLPPLTSLGDLLALF